MSSRRAAVADFKASADTHAGLWLEKGLADVAEKESAHQIHLEALTLLGIPADYSRHFCRWKVAIEVLEPFTKTAEARVLGRMVVGLGAESVLETSIALHRIYGVPYIPGSALKGLAAAAAHKQLQDPKWHKTGEDGKIGEWHRILFGDQESSGYVTFHDALWVPEGGTLPLDLDVMTVHHPAYYQGDDQGDAPPADWDNPNPIAFVSARGRYLLAVTGPEEWADAAMEILRDALEKDGIGAKTAAGYGRLHVDLPPKPAPLDWKSKLVALKMGTAAHDVPIILDGLKGEEQRTAALAIIAKLERKALKKKADKEWAKRLFELENPAKPEPPS
jgi:CRISPR-associated protein Cmr6